MINTEIRLIMFFEEKNGKLYAPAKIIPRADCDKEHKLLIAKLRPNLKRKHGKPLGYSGMP